jgi:hypothetical protein
MYIGSFLAYLIDIATFLGIIITTSCDLLMFVGK